MLEVGKVRPAMCVQFADAVWAAGVMKKHGLDLADLSLGMSTDEIKDVPFDTWRQRVTYGRGVTMTLNVIPRSFGSSVTRNWSGPA